MSNQQIIDVLKRMRDTHSLTYEENAALAWCIAKLYKEKENE